MRRRIGRGLLGLAAASVLLLTIALYGWRYGFTPLPKPIPGHEDQTVPPLSWEQLTTNHSWYWFHELARAVPLEAPETFAFVPPPDWQAAATPETWNQHEAARVVHSLGAKPAIGRCFRQSLTATDPQRPLPNLPRDFLAATLLGGYPLWQAAAKAQAGLTTEAFDQLVAAWRFQARLTPNTCFPDLFDERQGEQVNECLARPWRRLALTGPALPALEARRLLVELASVTNAMPSLERTYLQTAAAAVQQVMRRQGPNWTQVGNQWRRAGFYLQRDALIILRWAVARLVGTRGGAFVQVGGIRHLRRPVAALAEAVQRAVARPEDHERMRAAYLSHWVARIRRGEVWTPLTGKQRWLADRGTEAPWWRGWDRPAVWRSVAEFPNPRALAESLEIWRLYLESCRAVLALRAYRDQHGAWPEALAQLAPEWLAAPPNDPFTRCPLGYRRTADGWELWSAGPAGSSSQARGKPGAPPPRAQLQFTSAER